MKRPAIALLAVIYLVLSSGVVVNMHYCMGKMSSVQLQVWAPDACACGKKMESRKGCCKTELKVVKMQDAQKIAYAGYIVQMPVTTLAAGRHSVQISFRNTSSCVLPVGNSPPLLSEQDTYLRNCVFRI